MLEHELKLIPVTLSYLHGCKVVRSQLHHFHLSNRSSHHIFRHPEYSDRCGRSFRPFHTSASSYNCSHPINDLINNSIMTNWIILPIRIYSQRHYRSARSDGYSVPDGHLHHSQSRSQMGRSLMCWPGEQKRMAKEELIKCIKWWQHN